MIKRVKLWLLKRRVERQGYPADERGVIENLWMHNKYKELNSLAEGLASKIHKSHDSKIQ